MATSKPFSEEHPHYQLIATLAHTVTTLRHQRKMSRRALAEGSGLSERFIADVERAAANPSLLTLTQLAQALGTTVPRLLSTGDLASPRSPPRRRSLRTTGESASTDGQSSDQRPLSPPQHIALVGLRGAGKSTLGALLAKELESPFVELDQEIEKEAEMSLSQIFEIYGEPYYRRLEQKVLRAVLSKDSRSVIATGGGIVTNQKAWNALREHCLTIWIRAKPREYLLRVLEQGDHRPMTQRPHALKELEALLASRTPAYRQADLSVLTSGTDPAALARRLPAMLELHAKSRKRRRITSSSAPHRS